MSGSSTGTNGPKTATPPLMAGKRGLVMGVANDHSIAWGIVTSTSQWRGTAFTYQSEALGRRVQPLASSVGSEIVVPCDVSEPGSIEAAFNSVSDHWPSIDFVVHAIAYSDKEELKGKYIDTSRENFLQTLDISCFSFTEVAQRAARSMPDGGSLLTLTYDGSQRVAKLQRYGRAGGLGGKVQYLATDLGGQGVRVNAISAGPMRTLAGSAIGGARFVYKWQGENAPLRRHVDLKDIGGAGVYLLSDLSAAVTGETLYVDCGYHVVGMAATPA